MMYTGMLLDVRSCSDSLCLNSVDLALSAAAFADTGLLILLAFADANFAATFAVSTCCCCC